MYNMRSGTANAMRGLVFVFGMLFSAGASCAQSEFGAAQDFQYPYHRSPNQIPASDFARNDAISNAKLSPDGSHMIASFPRARDAIIKVVPLQPEEKEKHLFMTAPTGALEDMHWLDNHSILVQSRMWRFDGRRRFYPVMMLRVFRHNEQGTVFSKEFAMKRPEALVDNVILHTFPDDPENILISVSPDGKREPGVYLLNITNGEMKLVQAGRRGISVWKVDQHGNVRLGYGIDDEQLKIIVRQRGQQDWKELKNDKLFASGRFFPEMFDFDDSTMIVRSAAANGRFAFYRFNLETGRIEDKIYENPVVDAEKIEFSAADKKLLAIVYREDKLKRHFLDDEFKTLMAAVARALPDRSNSLLSQSADGRYLLVKSVSDRYPGGVYRLDTATREMEVVQEINPLLDPRLLSPTERVNYFARDGLEIPAYLTRPIVAKGEGPLPAIVLPHGGPFSRDTADYDRMAQFLASRGYLVLQPNYRGSTGYSFEFQALGLGEWGRAIQQDIEDGARYLVSEGLAPEGRVCVVGQSLFDSYSALLGVLTAPGTFACGVAVSPVPDLDEYADFITGWLGKGAARNITGGSKGRELSAVSPIRYAENLKRPLLAFYGNRDWVVSPKEMIALDKKLKKSGAPYTLLTNDKEGNGISRWDVRASFYQQMEEFLAEHLGKVDQSHFILPGGVNEVRTSTMAAGKARASKLEDDAVLARCLNSHYAPFITTEPARMPEKIGYCEAYLADVEDSPPATLFAIHMSIAKLAYLTQRKDILSENLATLQGLATQHGLNLPEADRLAFEVLTILALAEGGDTSDAVTKAEDLSAQNPEYLAAHLLLKRLAVKYEFWAGYVAGAKRELRIKPDGEEYQLFVESLVNLNLLEEAKSAAITQLLTDDNVARTGNLWLACLEVALREGDFDTAGILIAAFEGERADALDATLPGYPSLVLRDYASGFSNAHKRSLRQLSAWYYYAVGQAEKAQTFVPGEMRGCLEVGCLTVSQYYFLSVGDEAEADAIQVALDRKKHAPAGYARYRASKDWQGNLVRSMPAVPFDALSGHEAFPQYTGSEQLAEDMMRLNFEVQAATDDYSFWRALSDKAKAVTREAGYASFVVVEATYGINTDYYIKSGYPYDRSLPGKTTVEIKLLSAGAAQKLPAQWLLHHIR